MQTALMATDEPPAPVLRSLAVHHAGVLHVEAFTVLRSVTQSTATVACIVDAYEHEQAQPSS